MEATARQARLAAVYGTPERLLFWEEVEQKLIASMNYWLTSVHPKGQPQSRPIAGMWVDGRLYFGGSTEARWNRNLKANGHASVTLEDAEHPVILEGGVRFIRPDATLSDRIVAASNSKYAAGQKREDYEGVEICEFEPLQGLAWEALNEDATCWAFGVGS